MRSASFCALFLLALATPVRAGTPLPDAAHVTASGEGKVSATPDRARVSLRARYRNASPGAAKQAVDRGVAALLALVPGYGLKPADVSASDLSLSEDVDRAEDGRKVSNGFVATREVELQLRDVARLGELLDAALAAGMNEVENIGFESSREPELRAQARARAVAQARERAGGLATAFGAALGPVYSINSLNSAYEHGYGELDRIVVTGSRINTNRYLQPAVDYTERVSAVFELQRP